MNLECDVAKSDRAADRQVNETYKRTRAWSLRGNSDRWMCRGRFVGERERYRGDNNGYIRFRGMSTFLFILRGNGMAAKDFLRGLSRAFPME